MGRRVTTLMVSVLAAACGGGGSAPSQPPPQGALLDFSDIAGDWAGWGTTVESDGTVTEIWLVLTIEASAREGERVGENTVGIEGPNGELVQECSTSLFAEAAAPPDYTVTLNTTGGGCTGGTLEAEHDTELDVLLTDFTASDGSFTGSVTLQRGSDPGPAP